MTRTEELLKAQREAGDIESIPWWRSKMSSLARVGEAYVRGEPRRYYKDERTGSYYYLRIAECEMHRRW